jgi:hypothetical protein
MAKNGNKSWTAHELAASGGTSVRDRHRTCSSRAATKARTVNKVTLAQVGRVTEPGRYMFKFGW